VTAATPGQRIPGTVPYVMTDYARAAEAHLQEALYRLDTGVDVIPEVSAALAALRVEAGELEPDESLLAILDEDGDPLPESYYADARTQ
jgi:hypothetical protein